LFRLMDIQENVKNMLDDIQANLLDKAKKHREARTYTAESMEKFEEILNSSPGFIKAMWCGDKECEAAVKEKTAATARCMPFEQEQVSDKCFCCGKPAEKMVVWGRAY